MKLFSAPVASSPRRVRVYLAEKGIEVETIELDLGKKEHQGAAFRAIAPRPTVPLLLLDDGTVIDESVAICRYFEALHPDPPLFGRTPREIGLIEGWNRRIELEGYLSVMHAYRNSHVAFEGRPVPGDWPPLPQIPELATRGRIMFEGFTQALDAHLANRAYIVDDSYSFADLSGLVVFDFANRVGLKLPEGVANVDRWLAAMRERPSAQA